jgi:hypothetical protein
MMNMTSSEPSDIALMALGSRPVAVLARVRTAGHKTTNLKYNWSDLRFSRRWLWRMVSYGMLRRVALVRTDVSEKPSASFIRVTRNGELGKTSCNKRRTSVLTRATRRNILEDTILQLISLHNQEYSLTYQQGHVYLQSDNIRKKLGKSPLGI